jgi:hypothetical protein
MFSKVVGSTFVDGAQDLIRTLKDGDSVALIHEPENKFDENAVAVYVNNKKEETFRNDLYPIRIGYLPRETALLLKDSTSIIFGKVASITGRDKANVGCNIEFDINGGV